MTDTPDIGAERAPAAALSHRQATRADLPALRSLMTAAIDDLQKGFLTPRQIAGSHAIMGVDTTLIDDGTYFVVEIEGQIAGCGGWSRRATLYGGDHTAGRSDALLDPRSDAARVRAMYTHPAYTRRGVGRLVLELCEAAAAAEGFSRLQLMATMAGRPLYEACGYVPIRHVTNNSTGVPIPLLEMTKSIG